MTTLVSDFLTPIPPLSNIAPFTYKDGATYLSELEGFREYINTTLVDAINNNGVTLTDEMNDLILQVTNAISDVINSSIVAQDTVVAAIFNNPATATRVKADSLYATAAQITTINTSITTINTALTTLNNLVGTGRLSDTSLQAEFASLASVATLNTLVTSGRLSDASLLAEFAPISDHSAVATLNTLVGTGRLSDASLIAEFAPIADHTLISSGRLSDASLRAEFALSTNSIIENATVAGLLAVAPSSSPQLGIAANAPGMLFRYDSGWSAYGEATFTTASARDAVLTAPIVGMKALLTTPGYAVEYSNQFGTGGRWQKIGLLKPDNAVVSTSNGSSVINDDGTVVVTFTSAGNVVLKNCVPPFAKTDAYEIDLSWNAAVAATVTMKQASGGAVDSASAGYDTYGPGWNLAAASVTIAAANAASWAISASAAALILEHTIRLRHSLDSTKRTEGNWTGNFINTLATTEDAFSGVVINNRALTAFDGLQFAVTGAGVLTLKFRPLY